MSNNYSTQEKAAMFDRIYSYFANPMEVDFQCKECKLSVSKADNAKLRDALKALMMGTNAELCADRDEPDCEKCSMHHGKDECVMVDAMELLGIDMFGEPLEVKS